MRHLNDGTLRRLVDEPYAISDTQRAHVVGCDQCRERFGQIEERAKLTALALPAIAGGVDTSAALALVRGRLSAEPWKRRRGLVVGMMSLGSRRLLRPAGTIAAVAALGGVLAFTPAGSLAADLVTIFQPQQVTEVAVTSTDLQNLPDLQKYGTVTAPAQVPSQTVSGPSEASKASGMTVLTPSSLPSGIPSSATYQVLASETGSFTFSASKAQESAVAAGQTLPAMPDGINGSTLEVKTGEGVIATYGTGTDASIPPLIVGQMRAPIVSSSGVSVTELEAYLLDLPGVSPQLKAEIKAISDPSSTLPIPVPVDLASASRITVQGVQGLAIGDSTGLGSVVVWEKNGIIYGVGGALTQAQVLDVANGLH